MRELVARSLDMAAFDDVTTAITSSKAVSQEFAPPMELLPVDQVICAYYAELKRVTLVAANGAGIEISVSDGLLKVSGINRSPPVVTIESCLQVRIGETPFLWKPHEVLNAVIGCRFKAVQCFPYSAYLRFSNRPLLAFHMLLDVNSGDRFLYWDDSE